MVRLGLKAVFLRLPWLMPLAVMSEDEARRDAPRALGVVFQGC